MQKPCSKSMPDGSWNSRRKVSQERLGGGEVRSGVTL